MDLSRVQLKPGRPLDGKLRRLVDNGGTINMKTKPLHIPETSNSTFLGIVEEITINGTLLRILFTFSGLVAYARKWPVYSDMLFKADLLSKVPIKAE